MGLEIFPADLKDQDLDLNKIKERLLAEGWREVNFGFSIGRKSGGLDLQMGRKRILVYEASPEDIASYNLLEQNDFPRFKIVDVYKGSYNEIHSADIPLSTEALDSISFPNQEPTTAFLGSYEIMAGLAELLGRIYKKTGMAPEDLRLEKLALVPGQVGIVRLIPPLKLKPLVDWRVLKGQLLVSLNNQDPRNNHFGQVDKFEDCFIYSLQNGD